MAADSLHISISAEPIASIGGFELTNSIFTSMIVSGLVIFFALMVRLQLQSKSRPKGLQNFAEWIVEALYGLVYGVTGDHKKARVFFPLIATFFLFITTNNLFGLLPGVGTVLVAAPEEQSEEVILEADDHVQGITPSAQAAEIETSETTELEAAHAPAAVPLLRAGTADINTTLALALISVIATQFFGFHYQHFGYLKKFFNFSSPIMFVVGILELVSELAKIISFAFRLFGNIFAGEVLLVVMAFLVPILVPAPFYGLEIFVGFVQALVFAMLTLVFFNMATASHDEH